MSLEEIYNKLGTNTQGLFSPEANLRLEKYGPNKLAEPPKKTILNIFIEQFKSPVIYILLFASLVIYFMGDTVDALIILAVLVLNAVVGTFQEGRAQNTFSALQKMVQTQATVLRDKREVVLIDEHIVPGDILILKEGDKVPADARIISQTALTVDESAFTGESRPVSKTLDIINSTISSPADQKNMLFKGTYIVSGFAEAVAIATGKETYIGILSAKLANVETDVPLKVSIKKLSKFMIISVLFIVIIIFFLGLYRGMELREIFSTSVAVAVSVIPEGLPIVVTIILATGMRRMSKHNALVKNLQAVEALGQARVIAVDKTGTVTFNQMMLQNLYTDGTFYEITGAGYEPKGDVLKDGQPLEVLNHTDILLAGKIASLNSLASVAYLEEEKEWRRLSGDPTEAALLVFSEKIGFHRDELIREYPLTFEMPFTSETKYHMTLHSSEGGLAIFATGAPEVIISKSTHIWSDGKSVPMTDEKIGNLQKAISDFSKKGLRVIALAIRLDISLEVELSASSDLCFVGIVGMSDGIRNEVHDAVTHAQEAGVKVVMITGDYADTAQAIATQAHIFKEGDVVLTGKDLNEKSQKEILKLLPKVTVFARVSPDDKLRIIELYRANGQIIAMTGDGVNDALSLAAADLGVSMGKGGTEVAKEASDIVLLDDNFGSIVTAIEEGRNIYQSIQKVILYLFSTGIGEVLTLVVGMIIGYPMILIASQIIWLNFVTDGFLVVALSLEPKEKNLLDKNTLNQTSGLLISKSMLIRMVIMGTVMMVGSVLMFLVYLPQGALKAGTIVMTLLAIFQWFNAWNCRSKSSSAIGKNMFQNKALVGSLVIVILLQCLAVYNPFFQKILVTTPLALNEWLMLCGVALSVVLVDDIFKFVTRLSSGEKLNKVHKPHRVVAKTI